ncbi:hypothetical protein GJU40_03255 [Bacillus lacus]|uniref:Uncharacterized protein n=1 Tax=Metabacillus lacus TaxID=1983721 RepID=A0A7X2IWX6_9BACI|nr:hypothetical protein [Metabacillus lacus]MRX71189.1 hypothetical protein [Metabacillus lacus]
MDNQDLTLLDLMTDTERKHLAQLRHNMLAAQTLKDVSYYARCIHHYLDEIECKE